jgi:hypothetical protein
MKKNKEQLSKIINKVKSTRSLQVKIALVVGVLLLYHFLFGDIGNWNVEIETYTQKITNRDSIYSVSLENDKLKIHEYNRADLSDKYCNNLANYYKLLRVVSFDPMVVECNTKSEVGNIVITDGKKSRILDYNTRISEHLINIDDSEVTIPTNISLSFSEIENKYCNNFNLKLIQILEANPMKVICGYPDSILFTNYVTSGKWFFMLNKLDFNIEGQNEKYLVREDYSLVDKITGEITKDTVINTMPEKGSYNKLHINGVATVSKNNRFFISQHSEWTNSLAEVDKNGKITKLQEFYTSLSLHIPQINAIWASDDGKYLYMVVEKRSRGSDDLYFYIIDTHSKSMIYRKTLESGKSSIGNIYLRKFKENILLIYRLNHTIKTLKLFHKIKKEN